MTDNLTSAYDAFWQKRQAIRERQREELEKELAPERHKLAEAIWAQRKEGASVGDVANKLGLKNRNFVYNIINDSPLVDLAKSVREKPPVAAPVSGLHYEILSEADNSFLVTVTDATKGISTPYAVQRNEHGELVSIPDDWYVPKMDAETKKFYQGLIKAIENG
jgi:hypothetical protein